MTTRTRTVRLPEARGVRRTPAMCRHPAGPRPDAGADARTQRSEKPLESKTGRKNPVMKRRRIRLGALGAVAGLLAGAAVSIAPASAAPVVRCGQVITADTTLLNDVGPCPANGIIVGADNITLNLNGHKVLGQNLKTGNFAGVRLPNRTGVTVIGGRLDPWGQPTGIISGFDAGVLVNRGSNNSVRNLVVRDNIGPATREAFLGDGIVVMNSPNNTIHRNIVDHNGIYDGIAVLGDGAHANTVRDNIVTRTVALILQNSPDGQGTGTAIVIDGFLDVATGRLIRGNQVLDNTVRNNEGSGISNVNTQDGRVAGNTIEDNGFVQVPGNGIGVQMGMNPESSFGRMVIENNIIRRNRGTGIEAFRSEGHQILGNTVESNGFARPFRPAAISVSSELGGHLIKGNIVRGNNYSGIHLIGVDGFSRGRIDNNRIEGNVVTDNANVGIQFGYRGYPEGPNAWNNYVVSNYAVNNRNTSGGDLNDGSMFEAPQDCRGAVWDDNTYEIATPPCTGNGGTQVTVEPNAPLPGPSEGNGPPEGEPGPPAETPVRRGRTG